MIALNNINPKHLSEKKNNPVIPDKFRQKSFFSYITLFNVLIDLAILNAYIIIAINKTFTLGFVSKESQIFLIIANIIWLSIGSYNNIYQWQTLCPIKKRIYYLLLTIIGFLSLYSLILSNNLLPNLYHKCNWWMISNLTGALIGVKTLIWLYFRQNMPLLKYLIVGGDSKEFQKIESTLRTIIGKRKKCVGHLKSPKKLSCPNKEAKLLSTIIKRRSFDKLYYIESNCTKEQLMKIQHLCKSYFIDFEIIPKYHDVFSSKTYITNHSGLPLLSSSNEPLQQWYNAAIKRIFDIFFSLLVIIFLLSWLFPIIAFLIKKESSGPVFFTQKRTGYWNNTFKMYKFRSMHLNKECNKLQAKINDDRITKIGRFIRKTNIDELPQFINVLLGSMSVVGPRPHMLQHTREYNNLIENYLIRHRSKPGITGLAQVNGYRGITDSLDKMVKRVEYDAAYLKYWTFLTDLKCIFLTIRNIIKGEENAR